ncbi:MAG: alpha/beta hydrolase [Nitriliruptorales bacterium]
MNLDPNLFDPTAVAPETHAFNEGVERDLAALPVVTDVPVEVTRKAREEGRGIFGPPILSERARTLDIPGPAGAITLRVIEPAAGPTRGVYLHIHGGGFVLGAAHHQDPRREALADACGVATVSVEYRLAPEHPFPAGPDDCEAAALWLADHAADEFATDTLLIGGESGGAHLAALTVLVLRDRHGRTPFLGANLVYGVYDLAMTPSAANWGERNLVLSTPIMRWFGAQFLRDLRHPRDPEISPLYADLRGLPPALFTVGTMDPLLDDSLFMAARWLAAGNVAELEVLPGAIHAFDAIPRPLPLREPAVARIHRFLAGVLRGLSPT